MKMYILVSGGTQKREKEKIVKSGDELKKYFIKLCKKNDGGMVVGNYILSEKSSEF